MTDRAITPALAARLVAAQFPQWAGLPVRAVELDGWDNTTYRLGDELSVRLPSADAYVPQVDKEHRWLPVLAPHLPLPIPRPVAKASPGDGFPRPWSVYAWLPGEHATLARVPDLVRLATDLADFLADLYAIDPADGPAAGPHSFFRGGPLGTYDDDTRTALAALEGEVDATAATAVWEAGLAGRWDGRPVWVHGDVSAANLLVADGRLCAVIDFGCSAVGDPACDLAVAWTFLHGEARAAFRGRLPLDDGTWARGRAWALWKALVTLAEALGPDPATIASPPPKRGLSPPRSRLATGVQRGLSPERADAAGLRMGWRTGARAVLEDILDDDARAA